ncbi:MAG TPA: hypothetical protein VGM86_00470 [Thermoanaerobaculia bacterium]
MSTNTQQTMLQPDGQNAASTSAIPTVLYDSVNRAITAEVVVSRPPGASAITISVPPLTIPHLGTWTLVWDLRVISVGLTAQLANPGIVLQTLPPKVTLLAGPTGTATQWSVRLENNVSVASSFKYDIIVKTPTHTSRQESRVDLRPEKDEPVPVQDPVIPPPKR